MVALRPIKRLVYLRDGSAKTILRAATLEIEVADPTSYLAQSQYTDTGPTSPSADPITPGAWQGSHWSANFEVTGMTRPRKKSRRKRDSNPGPSALEADALPLGQRGGDNRQTNINRERLPQRDERRRIYLQLKQLPVTMIRFALTV